MVLKGLGIFLFVSVVILVLMPEDISAKPTFGNIIGSPFPGDFTNPRICESACRDRCYRTGGFSGYVGVPGCNQFCDCRFYFG